MKTVFICIPWFHPAFRAGGPVQSIANLVSEYQEGIRYKIFCGDTDLNNTALNNIEKGKWIRYNGCTEVWYALEQDRRITLSKLVEEAKPDIILIIGMFSWNFNIVPLLFCKTVQKKIISVRGMLHPGALSQKSFKKKVFISLLKSIGIAKRTFFHATDVAEKEIIVKVFGEKSKVLVAANYPHRIAQSDKSTKHKGSLRLLSIALISPMKNHLLVIEALAKCSSTIEYHICGPVKEMGYWQVCLRQQKALPANIKVIYHGDIEPALVPGYLDQSDVFILPSKSENFGHAIYEALSAGVPVITSQFTPWQNLEKYKAGLNVENNSLEISAAIERFAAMDEVTFNQWRSSATTYAAAALDFKSIHDQYEAMFSTAVS